MYDLIIIGAGPAGATLARLIGNNYKTLVIDRRQLIDESQSFSFEKCCGGLLAPDAQEMLAKFGLGVPRGVLVGPQLFTVRTIDMQNSIERYYQRHYINVDREKFDRWIMTLIPPFVEIRCPCLFKSFELKDGKIKVNFIKNGKEYAEHTKILVGADGAFSRVRNQLYSNRILSKLYIAIQEWFEVDSASPYYSAIFDKHITDFYSWTIPKEEFLIIGSAIEPKYKVLDKFELLKERLSGYGFEFSRSVKKNGAYLLRPQKANQICTGKGNLVLIGEAAGWISPSSAEGLSYSFKSALALAQALQHNPDSFLTQYYNNTKSLKRNIFLKNLKSPFMYNSFLRKLAMKSGAMSTEIHK